VPHIKVKDIQIYYEIYGTGAQTLTLIRGLGADLSTWFPQIPELSKHFRTLVFDNRGAGRTDKPDAPYSIRQMADDTNGLLEALSIRRTALLGISMGGMIAQEFAIHFPDKLSSLILGCTTFGGSESVPPPHETFMAILAGVDADEKKRQLQERAIFCDDTIARHRDVIVAYAAAKSHFPIPPDSLARQADAIRRHNTASCLGQIQTPTLIMTGTDDRLIPPENSRLIAMRIRGAILKEVPGGHLFMAEYPDVFNRAVIEFVKRHA
jgi:pimeloyl-ACP methyl ester carboxylesterase